MWFKKKKETLRHRVIECWSDGNATQGISHIADGVLDINSVVVIFKGYLAAQTDCKIECIILTVVEDSKGVFKYISGITVLSDNKDGVNIDGVKAKSVAWFRKAGICISPSVVIDVIDWSEVRHIASGALNMICSYIGYVLVEGGWAKSVSVDATVWHRLIALQIDGDKEWDKCKSKDLITNYFVNCIDWTDEGIQRKLEEEDGTTRDIRTLHRYIAMNEKSSARK